MFPLVSHVKTLRASFSQILVIRGVNTYGWGEQNNKFFNVTITNYNVYTTEFLCVCLGGQQRIQIMGLQHMSVSH